MNVVIVLILFALVCGIILAKPSPDDYENLHRVRRFSEADAKKKVRFLLYTRTNPTGGQQIYPNETSIRASNYNKAHPTRFIIHGFTDNGNSPVNELITAAYLLKGDFNVIRVDWGQLSETILTAFMYPIVAASTPYVGKVLSEFILFMNQTVGLSFEDVYLIGHNLGAQIAGYTGSFVKPNQIDTIFALDPAGPEFENNPDSRRLDKSDAKYVESIQTSTTFGMYKNVGHASFFPNFGTSQRGCLTAVCSDLRAYELFAESINSPIGFYAKRCSSLEEIREKKECTFINRTLARMGGEPSLPNREGLYYLYTNYTTPYAIAPVEPAQVVSVTLYNANQKDGAEVSLSDPGNVLVAGFNPLNLTRFHICDYKNKYDYDAQDICSRIKDAYVQRGFNVFIFNWLKALPYYQEKELFEDDLSRPMSDCANLLTQYLAAKYNQIYIIGDGFGARLASIAGQQIAPNKFDTIYAIDTNVDIYQDGATYIESWQGTSSLRNGHANIYVKYKDTPLLCFSKCTHELAVKTFIKSIVGNSKLTATKCESYSDSFISKNRCTKPSSPVAVGGDPSTHKENGDYYMEVQP